jgi:osmotically-inducible protein OsmY
MSAATGLLLALLVAAAGPGGCGGRSAMQAIDDAKIVSSINFKYVTDPMLKVFDIDVKSFEGRVVLFGRVPSAEAAERAARLAWETPGVRDVQSHLRVAR